MRCAGRRVRGFEKNGVPRTGEAGRDGRKGSGPGGRPAGIGFAAFGAAAALAFALSSLTGCGLKDGSAAALGDGSMRFPSPVEYQIFVSQETSLLENALFTRASAAADVEAGRLARSAELAAAEASAKAARDVADELAAAVPPIGYEADAEAARAIASKAAELLGSYAEAVRDGGSLSDKADEMDALFLSAGGISNEPYR